MKYFLHCCMLCLFFFYPALSLSGICSWDACNAAKRVWDSHLKGQMSRFCILKICLLLIFVVASFVLLLFQTQGLKVNPKSCIWTFSTRILYLKIKVARFARNVVKRRLLINDFQTLCAPRKNLERLFKFWPLSIFRLVKIRGWCNNKTRKLVPHSSTKPFWMLSVAEEQQQQQQQAHRNCCCKMPAGMSFNEKQNISLGRKNYMLRFLRKTTLISLF